MSDLFPDDGDGLGTPEEVVAEMARRDPGGDPWRYPEEVAAALFEAGYSCAEAVVFTLATRFGAGIADPQRLGAALGGGVGRLGHVCGCLGGFAVALGALAGRTSRHDDDGKERVYEATCRVATAVEEAHGSVLCRTLTGLDFALADDREEFHRRVQRQVCIPVLTLVVRKAAEEFARMGIPPAEGGKPTGSA